MRLSGLLVCTLLSHTLLTTPYTVWSIISMVNAGLWTRSEGTSRLLPAVANLLFSCNYSLNFYFYCLANRDIRKAVRAVVTSYTGNK